MMPENQMMGKSLEEVHGTVDVGRGKTRWQRLLAYLGPAYLVAVGYMDPGNWATDIEGGSRYGYQLIWVLVMSNLMAILLQSLSARLGIVYNKDLAQVNRETYPAWLNFCLYVLAEIGIAAMDLAEIIGMAIGLNLLTGLPLIWGVTITVFDTFLLLYLQKLGIRKMEAFIIGLIAIIFSSFLLELFFVKPDPIAVLQGLQPALPDEYALYIAIAILGATVMPHNLYLHSALVQTRKIGTDEASKQKALRWNFFDSVVALNLALFVNAAILVLAGTVFYHSGRTDVAGIEEAHQLLSPLVGNTLAPTLFAVALIAAGQSSTITGTLAGQIVMEGYLHIRINPWLRRIITRAVAVLPAYFTLLFLGTDRMTDLLILSQVVLSAQLAFAIIPLIYAVSDRSKMKQFTIKPWVMVLSVLVAALIIGLNMRMVGHQVLDLWTNYPSPIARFFLGLGVAFLMVLLILTIVLPWRKKRGNSGQTSSGLHRPMQDLAWPAVKPIQCVAITLDFSSMDTQVLATAMQQAPQGARWVLIHIVESATAKIYGQHTADAEAQADKMRLQEYIGLLKEKGIVAEGVLGYRNRSAEIARLCSEYQADLLIMGAHGHKGLRDMLYGETINEVRHRIQIPLLIVNQLDT
ncbi:MAG: Nramp family divalent metal transporter [Chitinophagaceae bacterium]